jgi:excisionase family DNA binding protein
MTDTLKPAPEVRRWLSITAYAQRYGVHRNTVRKWIANGLLIAWRKGRTVRVLEEAVSLTYPTAAPDRPRRRP